MNRSFAKAVALSDCTLQCGESTMTDYETLPLRLRRGRIGRNMQAVITDCRQHLTSSTSVQVVHVQVIALPIDGHSPDSWVSHVT